MKETEKSKMARMEAWQPTMIETVTREDNFQFTGQIKLQLRRESNG